MMDLSLPADILLLMCEELARLGDFDTLFHCALASKHLVGPALLWLYRIHNQFSIISSEDNDTDVSVSQGLTYQGRLEQQNRMVSKWALQWKSIIRSSLGTTAYPYCLYIQTLDLRNLQELIEDPKFRESAIHNFFTDELIEFRKLLEIPPKRTRKRNFLQLNVPEILNLVVESITSFVSSAAKRNKAAVALEELSGNIDSTTLSRCTSRLSRLRSMTLWEGNGLNESVGTAIAENCPNFDDLTVYSCVGDNADRSLASFFNSLRPNSLKSFTVIASNEIGLETLHSLDGHSKSLKSLKLSSLRSQAIAHLSLLENCDALETLSLVDNDGTIDLEATENDIFLTMIAWLGKCNDLQNLTLKRFRNGPSIVTKVCLRDNIHLKSLEVVRYPLLNSQDFHRAISHQTALESLELRAEGTDDAFADDIETLVTSICKLTELRYLNILQTSEYFSTKEIKLLASHLGQLEELSFSGYGVDDEIFGALSHLTQLRALNIYAISSFSFAGLVGYVSTLKESNQGLVLSVMNQTLESNLEQSEIRSIQDTIAKNVNGKFEFVLLREAESSFGSDSD
ncbi:hypothetical protein F5884DRAFT_93422 [Xylogone sp. PMI_703]|nr:hypothetical protein F5884DRAFT_93422 [Xylogone sp. PMI_703]